MQPTAFPCTKAGRVGFSWGGALAFRFHDAYSKKKNQAGCEEVGCRFSTYVRFRAWGGGGEGCTSNVRLAKITNGPGGEGVQLDLFLISLLQVGRRL